MAKEHTYQIEQILQGMRADYWRNLEAVDTVEEGARSEYLIVRCGDNRYGLPAANCREVLKRPPLVRVPRLPEHLRGIFNLRGEIVAVTDLCPLLGQKAQEEGENFRLVVVEQGSIKTALLVKEVEGLSSIADELVEPLAEGSGAGVRDLISGKVVEKGAALLLLDLRRLCEREEMIVDQKM